MLGTDPSKIVGSKNAKVILVEFADPNCTGCRRTHPKVKALVSSFGDRIAFKFKAFPIPIPGHETSIAACMAMEWAAEKGQYRKVYDAIWEEGNSERIKSEDGIIAILNESGLKGSEFRSILFPEKPEEKKRNEELIAKVQVDFDLGKSFNVGSTPSFVLLGDGVEPRAVSGARLESTLNTQPFSGMLRP
jgi:protein-disulfide isomerase